MDFAFARIFVYTLRQSLWIFLLPVIAGAAKNARYQQSAIVNSVEKKVSLSISFVYLKTAGVTFVFITF